MKTSRAKIVACSFILGLAASSLSAQKPATGAAPAAPLSASLTDLERVSEATLSDIANLQSEKPHTGWKTSWMFWRKSNTRRPPVAQMAVLKANLQDTMPGLIHDAQNPGSFSATFNLYNNLSLVCGWLDAVVDATRSNGKADGALSNDSAAMGRIRQDLTTYFEQAAAALDAREKAYAMASAAPPNDAASKPKKTSTADTAPVKKRARKKPTANQ